MTLPGTGSHGILGNDLAVEVPTDLASIPANCGGGFLDNLRGRCGMVNNWQCNFVSGFDAQIKILLLPLDATLPT